MTFDVSLNFGVYNFTFCARFEFVRIMIPLQFTRVFSGSSVRTGCEFTSNHQPNASITPRLATSIPSAWI